MLPDELTPLTRCTFIGEDEHTGAIARCARWEGHPCDDVKEKHDNLTQVIVYMAIAILKSRDIEPSTASIFVVLVAKKQAEVYWRRLVIDTRPDLTEYANKLSREQGS